MRGFGVYVASPYANAGFVRTVHEMLCEQGFHVTSTWAEQAQGEESTSIAQLRADAARNDRDIAEADAVLVIDFNRTGRETYAEMRLALTYRRPVIFIGKPMLSAWRDGVVRVSGLDDALPILVAMARWHAMGLRGVELANTAEASR